MSNVFLYLHIFFLKLGSIWSFWILIILYCELDLKYYLYIFWVKFLYVLAGFQVWFLFLFFSLSVISVLSFCLASQIELTSRL